MRLRKRGGVWHVRFWDRGERVEKSTREENRKAAEAIAQRIVREAADPDHARTLGRTLNDAFGLLLDTRAEEVRAGRKSQRTVDFYKQKAGTWLDILGHDFPLAKLNASVVRGVITKRRGEKVSDQTIGKELVALRAALRLSLVDGIWRGDPKAIIPVAFAPKYKPRKRWLPEPELMKLLSKLMPDEAARVAFMVATSAEWGATERAQRRDCGERVVVRGTKNAKRHREVPIALPWQKSLMEYVDAHAKGTGGNLFQPWPSAGQSLFWACRRAGIDHATPNDLRRTFAQWMRHSRMPLELVAPMMGHSSLAMLLQVYGVLDPDALEARVRAEVPCPTGAPQNRQTDAANADSSTPPETQSAAELQGQTGVGRVGVEPTTNGLKVPSPLWPLPGKRARVRETRDGLAPPVPHSRKKSGQR